MNPCSEVWIGRGQLGIMSFQRGWFIITYHSSMYVNIGISAKPLNGFLLNVQDSSYMIQITMCKLAGFRITVMAEGFLSECFFLIALHSFAVFETVTVTGDYSCMLKNKDLHTYCQRRISLEYFWRTHLFWYCGSDISDPFLAATIDQEVTGQKWWFPRSSGFTAALTCYHELDSHGWHQIDNTYYMY